MYGKDWAQVHEGVEVKLVSHPDGGSDEQYLLCRSSARGQKEAAMIELARQRLRAQLDKTHASLHRHRAKDPGVIERRIGRWLGRFPAAERLIEVKVQRDAQGYACGLNIRDRAERTAWAQHAHGAYLLRTNCTEKDPAKLWRYYMQLCQAEDAFRVYSGVTSQILAFAFEGNCQMPRCDPKFFGANEFPPTPPPKAPGQES